jgi:hypothetical protein
LINSFGSAIMFFAILTLPNEIGSCRGVIAGVLLREFLF